MQGYTNDVDLSTGRCVSNDREDDTCHPPACSTPQNHKEQIKHELNYQNVSAVLVFVRRGNGMNMQCYHYFPSINTVCGEFL